VNRGAGREVVGHFAGHLEKVLLARGMKLIHLDALRVKPILIFLS
jgi:hypothetical protein